MDYGGIAVTEPSETERTVRVALTGMHCANCARNISRELERTAGVLAAEVNFGTETASVRYDPARVTPGELVEAVQRAGYGARPPASAPHPGARLRGLALLPGAGARAQEPPSGDGHAGGPGGGGGVRFRRRALPGRISRTLLPRRAGHDRHPHRGGQVPGGAGQAPGGAGGPRPTRAGRPRAPPLESRRLHH